MLHLCEGPDKGRSTDRIGKKKPAKHPTGFEPTTSLLRVVCSTDVLVHPSRIVMFTVIPRVSELGFFLLLLVFDTDTLYG